MELNQISNPKGRGEGDEVRS